MIRINLLPPELRPVKRTPLPYILSFVLVFIAVVVMLGFFAETQKQIMDARAKVREHEREFDTLKGVTEEYNKLVALQFELKDKIETINEIATDRVIWSELLLKLAELAPPNFWYTGIKFERLKKRDTIIVIDEKTKKPKELPVDVWKDYLTLSGYAIPTADGNILVSLLTERAEKDEEFSALFALEEYKSTNENMDGQDVKSFEVVYLMKPKTKDTQ